MVLRQDKAVPINSWVFLGKFRAYVPFYIEKKVEVWLGFTDPRQTDPQTDFDR